VGGKLGRCDLHTAEFVGAGIYLPRTRCDFKAVKRLRIRKVKENGEPIFTDMNLCDFHANTAWFHKNVGWTILGEFVTPPKPKPKRGGKG